MGTQDQNSWENSTFHKVKFENDQSLESFGCVDERTIDKQ